MMIRRDQEEFGNRWEVTKPFIPKEIPSILLQTNTIGESLKGNKVERKSDHFVSFMKLLLQIRSFWI
jgi:hypothetical protein